MGLLARLLRRKRPRSVEEVEWPPDLVVEAADEGDLVFEEIHVGIPKSPSGRREKFRLPEDGEWLLKVMRALWDDRCVTVMAPRFPDAHLRAALEGRGWAPREIEEALERAGQSAPAQPTLFKACGYESALVAFRDEPALRDWTGDPEDEVMEVTIGELVNRALADSDCEAVLIDGFPTVERDGLTLIGAVVDATNQSPPPTTTTPRSNS